MSRTQPAFDARLGSDAPEPWYRRVGVLVPALLVAVAVGWLVARGLTQGQQRLPFLALGVSQAFHLGVIVAFETARWGPGVIPATVLVGGAGYLYIAAAAVVPIRGRLLVRLSWYVWFVFIITHLARALDRPFTSGLGVVALLVVGAARLVQDRGDRRVMRYRRAV